MQDDLLYIQKLQFQDLARAEEVLKGWLANRMGIRASSVRLVPKAVSLNSFNGFFTISEGEYFFKTHVEEQGVVQEYYHAELMSQAGYNIVKPLRTLHEQGQQMVIYPVVRWPVVFDLARTLETGGKAEYSAEQIIAAEEAECERLMEIYEATLRPLTASEHAQAPIHQLFWHRLAGERLKSFYAGKAFVLPSGERIRFEDLLRYRWVINEQAYAKTLGDVIETGKRVLQPERALWGVVGHGDAHFGNVFLEEGKRYLYFDPAFAGVHSPLLDIVKPLYHNVCATWMYFGEEVARELHITVELRGETLYVEEDYELSELRESIYRNKEFALIDPLVELLQTKNALPGDWGEIIRSALACCPLLTINLLERVPMPVSWLGLVHVIKMGHFSLGEMPGEAINS
jgi:hypothetical protein